MSEIDERVRRLWRQGKGVEEIIESIRSEDGVEIDEDYIAKVIGVSDVEPSIDLSSVTDEPEKVFDFLYKWQLERLKMYYNIERKMRIPVPDVRANISLMLMLLERKMKEKAESFESKVRDLFGLGGEE